MKFLDISLPINKNLVCWQDQFFPDIVQYSSINKGAASNNSFVKMELHTGTHIDVAYHFFDQGKKLGEFEISRFIGNSYVCEIKPGITEIQASLLETLIIPPVNKILFKTINNSLYRKKEFSTEFVSLAESGADWLLAREFDLVGIDYLSIEKPGSNYPVHKKLLAKDVVILEGLFLENISQGLYQLIAFPLKLTGTEAAPVRAILIPVDEK